METEKNISPEHAEGAEKNLRRVGMAHLDPEGIAHTTGLVFRRAE